MKIAPFCPELVFLDGGSFMMGSNAKPIEQPIHSVTVPSFWIGKYLVTLGEFNHFMEKTGHPKEVQAFSENDRYAVSTLNWQDATAYTNWLSAETGKTFRLPTDAEWEFAARGGMHSNGYKYAGSDDLDEVAWCVSPNDFMEFFLGNRPLSCKNQIHPEVGEKKPNELGLFDMSGLQMEFCLDDWQNNYDSLPTNGQPFVNLKSKSPKKVVRNAWWQMCRPFSCEIPRRYGVPQKMVGSNYGFRVVMEI